MKKIVLASTSPYRRAQLATLGIPFESTKPLYDEDQEKHKVVADFKHPHKISQHLSFKKGESVANAESIVVSGDQLVSFEEKILGKPGTKEKAIEQLMMMQGKTHELVTACTVFNGLDPIGILNITTISLKPMSRKQIEYYVSIDNPVDCAGSYKIEKNGIQLVDALKTDDFTAIQGLPLLALAKVFNSLNIGIPFLGGK